MVYNKNRKAVHDYHLMDMYTAGMVLEGPEVKAIRDDRISLKEAYVKIEGAEAFLMQSHISKPENFAYGDFNEVRPRKLLLTKKEINELYKATQENGITIVPLKIYQPDGTNTIKLDIAVAKGKRAWDKRHDLKTKQANIDTARQLKDY